LRAASPLRYPGGKWRLAPFFERLISLNFEAPPLYVEPYAGGASLALTLLLTRSVTKIVINDLDPCIYAFWQAALTRTEELVRLVQTTPVTPREWKRQKEIVAEPSSADTLSLGFATFFLNRTNHSGILNGGMIGGKQQRGPWRIDARFNRPELVRRLRLIASARSQIRVFNLDAVQLLRELGECKRALAYLDPPYYGPGKDLYLNAYAPSDHAGIRDAVANLRCPWIVSYDDVIETRSLYRGKRSRHITLLHTARELRRGDEVMFFSQGLRIPRIHPYHRKRDVLDAQRAITRDAR